MNIADLITKAVYNFPDNCAVIDEHKNEMDFKDLYARSCSLANALLELGCLKGDRVALMMPNSMESFIAIMALDLGGYVRVPINTRCTPGEVSYLLKDSGSKALIFSHKFQTVIHPLEKGIVEIYISDKLVDNSLLANIHDFHKIIASAPAYKPNIQITENDLSFLAYTSGTTGRPKGAMLTHGRLLEIFKNIMFEPLIPILESDICLHIAPFTGASYTMIIPHLIKGAANALVYSTEITNTLLAIEKLKVTRMLLVPTLINMVVNHPDIVRYDISSIRHILYGSSPIAYELLVKAIKCFGNVFEQFYGMAEAAPATMLLAKDHRIDETSNSKSNKKLSSAGKPCYGVDLMVVNEKGEKVKPGEIGEILHKGKHVFQGYWNKPELNDTIFRDGWFLSGDLATVDEDGYIYIVDRKHDLVISGGFNVYPTEVENVLYSHPKVLEAAVIGIPDDKWGEAVKAIVVSREKCSEEELINYCKGKLGSYKVPKSFDFTDDLPLTGNGKVDKKLLRKNYWGNKSRHVN